MENRNHHPDGQQQILSMITQHFHLPEGASYTIPSSGRNQSLESQVGVYGYAGLREAGGKGLPNRRGLLHEEGSGSVKTYSQMLWLSQVYQGYCYKVR